MKEEKGLIPLSVEFISDLDGVETKFHKFQSKTEKVSELRKNEMVKYGNDIFRNRKNHLILCGDVDEKIISSHIPIVNYRIYRYSLDGQRISALSWNFKDTDDRTLISDMDEIGNKKYLDANIPHEVIVDSPKYLQEYIKIVSKNVPLISEYNYIGFMPNSFNYIHSGGVISEHKDTKSHSTIKENKSLKKYKCPQKQVLDAIDNLINLTPVSSEMLAFLILSFTFSKYQNDKPRFAFLLYGTTGTFKSTIAKHIWGIFKEYYTKAPINIKVATLPAIHYACTQFRDCVCLLDDGAPSKYGNDEVVRKCESITRAVGDDTGRNVMQGDSVKNSKPCCLSAITAEFQPLTDSSDIARAFLYKLESGEIDKKNLSKAQKQKHCLVRFVTDYLGWICSEKWSYMKSLEWKFKNFRKQNVELGQIHNRIPENVAWMQAGFEMFLEFICDKYKVSLKRLKKYKKIFNSAVGKSIKLQKEELHSKDEAKLFVDTINVMRASNKVSLSEIQEGKKNIASCSNNCIGYYDGIYIYLIWEEAYAKANEFLRKADDGFSLPKRELETKLIKKGYLIPAKDGRHKVKKTINGSRSGLMRFDRKKFENNK